METRGVPEGWTREAAIKRLEAIHERMKDVPEQDVEKALDEADEDLTAQAIRRRRKLPASYVKSH